MKQKLCGHLTESGTLRDGRGVPTNHYLSRVPLVLRGPSAHPFHKENGGPHLKCLWNSPTSRSNRDRMVDLRPVTPLSPSTTLRVYSIGMSLLGYGSIQL